MVFCIFSNCSPVLESMIFSSLTAGDWLFALKTCAAGLIALFVAFRWDLHQPYWALLTVLIVAQPYTGMVRSKALYRFVGTLVGASMAVFLVPRLVDMPEFLTLALAAWISLCLYLSLIDGTPRSYAFILAGFTVALIGFPSVSDPQNIFPTAVSRVEEVCLGILSTFLVNELFFPRSALPLYEGRVRRWLEQFSLATENILSHPPGTETLENVRHRLSIDLAALDPLSVFASYDTSRPDRIYGMNALRSRLRELLPLLTEVVRHLEAIGRDHPEKSLSISPLLRETCNWIHQSGHSPDTPIPEIFDRTITPQSAPESERAGLILLQSLKARLHALCALWKSCQELRHSLRGNAPIYTENGAPLLSSSHRDHLLAAMSATAVFITVVMVANFWIFTEWPDGPVATMMAAVVGSFFAAMDDPVPAIVRFLSFLSAGSVLGILTLFIFLPMAHNFLDLSLLLALILIPAGLFLGRPEYSIQVLSFSIGFAGVLALSPTYSGHFAHSVNTAIAQNVGIFLMAIMTRVFRSVGADWSVRRLYRADLSDLAVLARPDNRQHGLFTPATDSIVPRQEALARIVDRTPQLSLRLQALTPEERRVFSQGFLHPSIGRILQDIHDLKISLPGQSQEKIDLFQEELANILQKHPLPGHRSSLSNLLSRIRSIELSLSSGDPGSSTGEILTRLAALATFFPPESKTGYSMTPKEALSR